MKKAFALILSLVLMLSVFTGCQQQASTTDESATGAADTATAAAEVTETTTEKPVIHALFPTLYNVPTTERQEEVSAALNTYLDEQGYSFHVQLDIIGIVDNFTQPFVALAAGEEMDVWQPFDATAQCLPNTVANGYLIPLDQYFETELKDVRAISDLDALWALEQIGGETYAVPCNKGFILSYCLLYNKTMAEEMNIDMSQVDGIEDLEGIYAQVKAASPDTTAVGLVGAEVLGLEIGLAGDKYYQTYDITDGASLLKGSTTVENYYRSDAFVEAVNTAYDWAQKGYSDPNSSANNASGNNAVEENMFYAGDIFSIFGTYSNSPESTAATLSASYGIDIGVIPLANSCNAYMVPNMGIAYTSKHPAEAAQLINLIMTDPVVMNTIWYGIEGTDYVWADDKSVEYPNGGSINDITYGMGTINGNLGNQFITYPHVQGTQPEDIAYMRSLMENAIFSPAFGFVFDTSNVTSNLAAVSNVVAQYRDALCYGDVNPEEYLPKFWADLDAAGINDLISEAQTQLDAFLASK